MTKNANMFDHEAYDADMKLANALINEGKALEMAGKNLDAAAKYRAAYGITGDNILRRWAYAAAAKAA